MRLIFPLAILLLLAPLTAATWSSHGQEEPDTTHDLGWMWMDPPSDPGQRHVYFQAFPTLAPLMLNPNAEATGSRLQPAPFVEWQAIVGVWLDCNGDGHIGHAELGAISYPVELLEAGSPCREQFAPGRPVHHDGSIIREFLAIGRLPLCPDDAPAQDPPTCLTAEGSPMAGTFQDWGARVWGDAGPPGAGGVESCPLMPLPRGSTSNTGRLIRYFDCMTQHAIVGLVNSVDDEGRLGLRFEDVHHPEESDSHLVQDLPVHLHHNPITGQRGVLDDDAEEPAFLVWDCESQSVAPELHPTPMAASWWEGLVLTVNGALGECGSYEPGILEAIYMGLEDAHEPGDHAARRQNDVVMTYRHASSLRVPVVAMEPWRSAFLPVGPGAPELRIEPIPTWRAIQTQAALPQLVSRSTLEPQPAAYWTFYAHLSPSFIDEHALHLPHVTGGVYGSEACGTQRHDTRRGWACDPADWWQDPAGDTRPTDEVDGWHLGAVIGDPYRLRDVECIDGTIARGMPVKVSLADVSRAGPCEDI